MVTMSIIAKRIIPTPVRQVLPLATVFFLSSPNPSPTPEPMIVAAERFYDQLKNRQFNGASAWFGQQTLITDESIAQAVNEMQFVINEVSITPNMESGIGLRIISEGVLQNQTTGSLTVQALLTPKGKWSFPPIGPVRIVTGTKPVRFSGTQKKAENRVTGS